MGTLHVSCAAEGGYVIHSAALLDSVLAHRGGLDVHVHYLHGPRLPARSGALLRQMVEGRDARISFLAVGDERVANLPSDPQFTAAMWHRAFLPELLPDVERVLYLDVDTVVMDALEPLWTTDVSGHYLAAVTNVLEDRFATAAELALDGPEAYFNSGVLLLNLGRCEPTTARPACVRRHATRARLDVARPGLPQRRPRRPPRVPLHPRWNVMNSLMGLPSRRVRAGPGTGRSQPAGHPSLRGPGREQALALPLRPAPPPGLRPAPPEHAVAAVRRQGVTPLNVVRRLTGARRRPPRLNP